MKNMRLKVKRVYLCFCCKKRVILLHTEKKIEIIKKQTVSIRICQNKRPGRLIFSSKNISKTHRFCVLPPLKNHPSQPIGFMYSPLWKSPIKPHRFYVLPPLKNHYLWWALISGWAFISANTVNAIHIKDGMKWDGMERKWDRFLLGALRPTGRHFYTIIHASAS